MLTAYATVYDGLSLWYGADVMAQEPHRNRVFSES
jgi:hypothetical protein